MRQSCILHHDSFIFQRIFYRHLALAPKNGSMHFREGAVLGLWPEPYIESCNNLPLEAIFSPKTKKKHEGTQGARLDWTLRFAAFGLKIASTNHDTRENWSHDVATLSLHSHCWWCHMQGVYSLLWLCLHSNAICWLPVAFQWLMEFCHSQSQ